MFKIIESQNLVEQFRFPRTKKRRIRNKWTKRPENFRPARHAMQMGDDTLICHPQLAAKLRRQLAS